MGKDIGTIKNNINNNTAAYDFLFIKCNNKDTLHQKLNRSLLNDHIILTKNNLVNYIN